MKIKLTRVHAFLCFTFCFVFLVQAQKIRTYKIISSNLGSSGSSQNINTPKGTYNVSYSIGQSSVIGTSSNKKYHLRQGYQQPLPKFKIIKDIKNNSIAKVYPNPFSQKISVLFQDELFENISILLYDLTGKLVYKKLFFPSKHIQLDLNKLSNGAYFFKTITNRGSFTTKLIKI